MKELEKVKGISIGSVLLILAVLIGVLTYERPKNLYAMSPESTLEGLTNTNFIISMDDLANADITLVDIRSPYEFEKGHIENAVNIPTPEILKQENQDLFEQWNNSGKAVVLYGNSIEEANIPFLLLYQMGYDNLKLLSVNNSYVQNNLITQPSEVGKSVADIRAFIDESVKNANKKDEVVEARPVPKQVITVQKKKKRPVEGGC